MNPKKIIFLSTIAGFLSGALASALVHAAVVATVKYLRLKVM